MIRFILFFLSFSGVMLFFLDFVLFIDYKPAFRMLVGYYTIKTAIYIVVIFFYVYGMHQENIDRITEHKQTIKKLVNILEEKLRQPSIQNISAQDFMATEQRAGGNITTTGKKYDIPDDFDVRR